MYTWRALEPGERALESGGRVPEPAGRTGRALNPAQKSLEPFKANEEAGSHLGGPAGSSGGGRTEREIKEDRQNGAFLVCGGTIGHYPLWGRCPKRE